MSKSVDRRYGIEPLERIYPLALPDRNGEDGDASFSFARTPLLRFSVASSRLFRDDASLCLRLKLARSSILGERSIIPRIVYRERVYQVVCERRASNRYVLSRFGDSTGLRQ